ncbi:NADPH Oxidase [Seminavis robusta]|uniref:NADPH Oxidase n=1 Tax=Seminavis robusta TaxID=568900 RepID=A0A9N8E0D3_9STRA|nr:NADPH Oxidase [Seminavis robusta]|eukprot:Sro521_g159240.1 NADPH Oxidase (542) ;mRNA; r:6057-7983
MAVSSSAADSGTGSAALGLLYKAEFFLRRQLQTGDGLTPGLVDPSIYQQQPVPEDTSQSRGRTVLTILYLCVLGLCFVVPVFYYFRLHCFEEHARRELELDFTAALEQSEQHRDENRQARRKYIEERRARIVQLMMPVRMVLKEENFPDLVDGHENHNHNTNSNTIGTSSQGPVQRAGSFLNLDFESEKYNVGKSDESATQASEDILSPYASDDEETNIGAQHDNNDNHDNDNDNSENDDMEGNRQDLTTKDDFSNQQCKDLGDNGNGKTKDNVFGERGIKETKSQDEEEQGESHSLDGPSISREHNNPYEEEETPQVRLPVPGLPMGSSCFLDASGPQRQTQDDEREMRLTPGSCTICLSNYKVGSDVVWSSNESCDHHFHSSCMEKWLIKQRDGPLCPICRRDFIVDPLDLLEQQENNNNNNHSNHNVDEEQGIEASMFHWDPAALALDDDELVRRLGPIVVTAPGEPEISRYRTSHNGGEEPVEITTQLEEGLRSVGVPSVTDSTRNSSSNNNFDSEIAASAYGAPDESTEDGMSVQL